MYQQPILRIHTKKMIAGYPMYLLRCLLCLWLMLLAAVSLALLVGRTTPDRLSTFGLATCAGEACFEGITPGVTEWSTIRSYLSGFSKVVSDDHKVGVSITERLFVSMYRNAYSPPLVTFIEISDYTHTKLTPTRFPPAGDFVLNYGNPCLVVIDNRSLGTVRLSASVLVYPSMVLFLDTTSYFDPSSRVRRVQLQDVTMEPHDLCKVSRFTKYGVPWVGFASNYRYLTALLRKQLSS